MTTLAEALLLLKTPEEARRFLRDLCTPGEISELELRWTVACALDKGDAPYRAIAEKLGASLATVVRVARFLKQEPHQGYRAILDRIAHAAARKTRL